MNAPIYKTAISLAILISVANLFGASRVDAGGESMLRQQAIQKVKSASPGTKKTTQVKTMPRPAGGDNKFKCLPTCDVTDGRFLALAGQGLQALSSPELFLQIAVPAGTTSFGLGIFDGDGGEVQSDGRTASWDGGVTTLFEYALFADPQATGSTLTPVDLDPSSPVVLSDTMPDNEWMDFTVATGPEAASPSGNFFYLLKITLLDPSLVTLNAFKVRTSAVLSSLPLNPAAHPFSYIANWTGPSDISVIYPKYPATTPTTYDGSFRFFIDVPVSQTQISLWDGDFDHGNADLTSQDTDDPDTPGAPFLPSWATPDARPEGIAAGSNGGTGDPADDSNGEFSAYIVRSPAIRYDLLFPDNRSFANDNPSGNQEWEQLMIATAPFDRTQMDYHADSLPPGTYELRIQGMDMLNLNSLMVPYRVACADALGAPCKLLRPYLVGGTVSTGQNVEIRTSGTHGLPGVLLELRDWNGALLGTTTTDANGYYTFETDSGQYEIVVAAANFAPGAALAGYTSTAGDSLTDTVVADNVLTYDFLYNGVGSIGNRVWYDINGNGLQDAGEVGIAGVTLELGDAPGVLRSTTATAKDGTYSFGGLPDGTYSVTIVTTSLPEGLLASDDLDGIATPDTAVVTLTGGQNRTDVDFGYRGVLCYMQPEIVQLQILDAADRVVATVQETADGSYTVPNLKAGTYKIRTTITPATRH
jgi:hypothetical protein